VNTQTVQGGRAERVLWLVERPEFAEFVSLAISLQMTPSVKVRGFERPEPALQALEYCEEPPDLLMTAFHFDGDYSNGLWLVQEARKLHSNLRTVVTTGFPLEHLQGVTADWQAQPNLLLHKGEDIFRNWFPALKELLSQPGSLGPTPRRVQLDPAASKAFTAYKRGVGPGGQRRRPLNSRPLVYFVGPSESLNTLKRCMGRDAHPPRFKRGYDWEHFENPETAWASLEEVREKPEALVTDYYFSGGYTNGLKLVRHAQRVVPGIWTVLVSWLAEHHIQGIMEGSSISPDLSFHIRNYRSWNQA
jgi:hypothetical protein